MISGLTYIPNYISDEKHDYLIEQIDNNVWLSDLARRVQHYGYKYDYKARQIDSKMSLGKLPIWVAEMAVALYVADYIDEVPDQVIVNEYNPGQGISKHIDCIPCFTDTVVSLSLGSPCVMSFTEIDSKQQVDLLLEPKSLLVLKDDARYRWTHAIFARKKDSYGGHIIKRERRLSMTFRKVILQNTQ